MAEAEKRVDTRIVTWLEFGDINATIIFVDFEKLDELTTGGKIKSVAIIGSGFLGTELTTSLAMKGKEQGFDVVQIFPEKGVLSRVSDTKNINATY